MSTRVRVLVSAYACEPEKGSEPGVGWNWVKQIARFHEVWVITRTNNRTPIERALSKEPMPNVRWVYFDLPRWGRIWKHGQRGVRLYYCLWQAGVYFKGRRLHKDIIFNLIHHVTFVNYWMPSFLALLPVPFVWGPVGGGESSPRAFHKTFSFKGKIYECLRGIARRLGEEVPLVHFTAKRARFTFATTPETEERLKKLGCQRVSVLPQSALPREEIQSLRTLPLHSGYPFRWRASDVCYTGRVST